MCCRLENGEAWLRHYKRMKRELEKVNGLECDVSGAAR